MRRLLLSSAVIVVGAAIALACWDFAKLDRSIPQSVVPDARATTVLVEKENRRLTLLRHGTPIKTYAVSLGREPKGHKQQEGDGRTPEGRYTVDFKNQRSRFHLALRVSYPDAGDREQARKRGVPPGSDIMIHGIRNGLGWVGNLHLRTDWTDGCIAVTNKEIEEIWSMVDVGTSVEIRP